VRGSRAGATLRDRFALGTLKVAKSGDAICVAHADAALAKRVLAGDRVRLTSPKYAFVDPWAEKVAATKTITAPRDPYEPDHAKLAHKAWQDTIGQSPEARVAIWQRVLADDPGTPFAKAITAEIASLRAQITERDAALAAARARSGDRAPRIARLADELLGSTTAALVADRVERVAPGKPIELALLQTVPIDHAWLYARARGDAGFHRVELARAGDAYLRATIDGALVRTPAVEWYVEASALDGQARPVLGSQTAPNTIEVDRVVDEPPPAHGRSRVDLSFEYVDFGGPPPGKFDHYYQAEADFMYRFLEPVYSVRLGFGTLSGVGGPKNVIDAHPADCIDDSGTYQCRRVDFSYVYTEVELKLAAHVALLVRPQAGMLTTDTMAGTASGRCRTADDAGCNFGAGLGGRVRLRLGDEVGTNLVIGAGFTSGVGTKLEAAYHWLPAQVVPVRVAVEVTDEPVPSDFGVRLIGDVGLRKLAWVYPSLRVSYQARDLQHTGYAGGAAVSFDW
jgi:hypothetical protein